MFGKCLKRCGNLKSHHFPVTGHSILSFTGFSQLAMAGKRFFFRCHALKGMKIRHSQLLQIRNLKILCTFCNMSQCVTSGISILRSIRHCSHTKRINDNCKNPVILLHLFTILLIRFPCPFYHKSQNTSISSRGLL